MITKRSSVVLLASMLTLGSCFLHSQTTSAQSAQKAQGPSDQDIELLRKDIRSQKRQMVAANMKLTDKESEQFWPIYDQYTAELVKINDKKYSAIKQFAENYDT
jgi:hypothetical protein